ncbi:MAG: DegT/DnrJ/EryC1/StrS family aminotransferase [Acidobacteria bacterium]|nr:DegT/DnrJ/EryC1/StrS family aminotransferase [Acidobacteriota bacterium]MBI3657609.1 DegT/DnrJ/EryC1/StrS family aminotransferase [Acidobacteriota bacterium]
MATFKPSRKIGVGGVEIGPEEKRLVMEALESGRLSAGPLVASFERELARLHQRRYGIMCNSGTSALHVALATLKETERWDDGDEVLVPALTFIATSNSVLYNKMKPVFVDVDACHYTIDPRQIELCITPRTRAIIPVHLFGQPCDMTPILALAEKQGLKIIEDSAQAMFVNDHGRPVGSFGDMACFSTYVAHIIVTGAGGMVVADDPRYAEILRSLVSHGRHTDYTTMDDDREIDPEKLFRIVEHRFAFERLGFSFRATELEGALGMGQLSHKEALLCRRQENARYLTSGLEAFRDCLQLPDVRPDAEHAFMMYPIVITHPRLSRSALIRFLETNLIETRYLFPLLSQPIYRRLFGDLQEHFPVAQRLYQSGFYIGCHPSLGTDELDYVIGKFKEFFAACDWRSMPSE